MSTPQEYIARELRNEVEARLASLYRERDSLQDVAGRLAAINARIAALESLEGTAPVAPPPTRVVDEPVRVTSR